MKYLFAVDTVVADVAAAVVAVAAAVVVDADVVVVGAARCHGPTYLTAGCWADSTSWRRRIP